MLCTNNDLFFFLVSQGHNWFKTSLLLILSLIHGWKNWLRTGSVTCQRLCSTSARAISSVHGPWLQPSGLFSCNAKAKILNFTCNLSTLYVIFKSRPLEVTPPLPWKTPQNLALFFKQNLKEKTYNSSPRRISYLLAKENVSLNMT